MHFRAPATALLLVAAAVLTAAPAHAANLFTDDFDLDPGTAGTTGRTGADPNTGLAWLESIDQGPNTGVLADINASGGEAIFDSDVVNGGDFELYRIDRTIDATGFVGLSVSLGVRENNTQESDDYVRIYVDNGGGFTQVGNVNGEFGTTVIGPVLLGGAYDNSVFDVRVEGRSNVENFYLDFFAVEGTNTASYDLIYSDAFDLDPAAAGTDGRTGFATGWTEEVGPTSGASVTGNGDQAVFSRAGNDTNPSANDDFAQITHTFSTVGLEQVAVDLTAFQTDTFFEGDFDRLQILYSVDGVNFTELLTDAGVWDAMQENVTGGSGDGNTTPTTTDLLVIGDPLAANNPLFAIRIRGVFNAAAEQYLIDGFNLYGVRAEAIPTPAALPAGLGLLALTLARRRRRA